jgi:hypothetical protein
MIALWSNPCKSWQGVSGINDQDFELVGAAFSYYETNFMKIGYWKTHWQFQLSSSFTYSFTLCVAQLQLFTPVVAFSTYLRQSISTLKQYFLHLFSSQVSSSNHQRHKLCFLIVCQVILVSLITSWTDLLLYLATKWRHFETEKASYHKTYCLDVTVRACFFLCWLGEKEVHQIVRHQWK